MTAVTLSTLADRSLVIDDSVPAAGRLPGREEGRCVAVVSDVDTKSSARPAPGVADPASARAPRPVTEAWARPDVREHRARGLLNLITLLTRCLESGGGSQAERLEWRRQTAEAADRLEMLYQSGLPRTFLTDRASRPRGAQPPALVG